MLFLHNCVFAYSHETWIILYLILRRRIKRIHLHLKFALICVAKSIFCRWPFRIFVIAQWRRLFSCVNSELIVCFSLLVVLRTVSAKNLYDKGEKCMRKKKGKELSLLCTFFGPIRCRYNREDCINTTIGVSCIFAHSCNEVFNESTTHGF